MSDSEPVREDPLSTLRSSAPESVTVERTTVERFADDLAAAVERPAIGTPLPFDGCSLSDAGIDALPTGDDDDDTGGRAGERERARLLREAATGVTPAGLGIAEHGTVSVRSRPAGDELVSLYPERHVVVLRASDVVPDVRTATARMAADVAAGRSGEGATASQVLTTGPSATGDMGGLVEGVHGPREVHVLGVTDR